MSAQREKTDIPTRHELNLIWAIRDAVEATMKEAMGRSYVDWQLFIPAGRAFFTSLGRPSPLLRVAAYLTQ
jgi:hypothetical protein